jgi:O-methyltransferase
MNRILHNLIRAKKPGYPLLRFEIVRRLAGLILPQYRFKWPQMAWWDDVFFNDYLKKFNEIDGMNTDRRWMLYQLMRLVYDVPGDTAECGVYNGAGSYLICRVNQGNPSRSRMHFMFDAFSGLPEPSRLDGSHWSAGDMCCDMEIVESNMAEVDNYTICRGWIPNRFAEVNDRRFALVHIDVDLYQPTRDSIEFFYPLMLDRSIIVCDDYGMTSCPGATLAIDEYLQDKPEKMVLLDSGGGFLMKGCPTAPGLLPDGSKP